MSLSTVQKILKNLPKSPGIYQFFNTNHEIIYVGKSVNLKSRVNSYFNGKSKLNFAKRQMVELISDIQIIVTNNETESLILENTLIKKHQPKYNILLKDDKNYLYIKVTTEKFPKIIKTRIKNNSGTYFGPYTHGPYVFNILRLAKKIFGYGCYGIHFFRQGNEYNLDKYIFKNHTVEGKQVTEKDIQELYMKKIEEIKSFLKGDIGEVIATLENRMKEYAKELKFEEAAKIKYDIESLKMIEENQIVRDFVSGDFDVVHIVEKYDHFFIGCIEIRDSKITGFFHYETEEKLGETKEDILSSFIEQRFAENYEKRKPIFITPFELQELSTEIKIEIPKIGGKLDILKLCYKNTYEFAHKKYLASLSTKGFTKKTMQNILNILGYNALNPHIIFECNDISHLSGSHTVASRSIIENGKKNPSKYRKFTIKTLKEGKIDDFSSMREVMTRRIKEFFKLQNMPDLIIIDGGKGQLSSVLEILENYKKEASPEEKSYLEKLQLVSIAKREEELFVPKHEKIGRNNQFKEVDISQNGVYGDVNDGGEIENGQRNEKFSRILLKKDSDELRLIQSIRDEAHRFAITFNRDKRISSMKKSVLESLPGIGPVTRKKIIKHFGSASGLKEYSKSEIETILGKKVTEILDDHGLLS